jgi:26S proteasome regulatory subunit N9
MRHYHSDPQTHLNFLTSLLSRIDTEKSPEAHVLLLATIAHAKLVFGDLEGTKTDMDAAWKVLDILEGVENGVNAAYYGVAADYYKVCSIVHLFLPSFSNFFLFVKCRLRRSTPLITGIPSCTWRVWIPKRTCPPRRD